MAQGILVNWLQRGNHWENLETHGHFATMSHHASPSILHNYVKRIYVGSFLAVIPLVTGFDLLDSDSMIPIVRTVPNLTVINFRYQQHL